MPKTAGIILIGNEILSGKTVDANAAYLCRELRELGVEVRRVVVIPDEVSLIAEEVAAFSKAFDLVFTSGGVGPTHDDVTIEGVARAMGVPVVRHPELVALLERYYRDKVTDAALRMAEIPEGAELITGNGLRFPNVAMRNVYVLPGVPEIFRRKFDAMRERFRDAPIQLKNACVRLGDWVTPHVNGVRYFDKPPILYWIMAGAFAAAGVGEAAARVGPALAAVGIAAVTARLGFILGGGRVALLAGLMVIANLGMYLYGRLVKPDMVFILCIVLAYTGFAVAYKGAGRWGLVVFYASLGAATMTKGVRGALGPPVVVGLFLILTRERPLAPWAPWWGVLLLLALVVPWYALVEARNPGFLWYTLVDNHLLNFTRHRLFPDEDVPLGTLQFLGVTLLAFLPWSLATPWAVARALRRPWEDVTARLWVLIALWPIVVIGFFALSPFKLPHYGLPALPALALLVARLWDESIDAAPGSLRPRALIVPIIVVFVLAALAFGLAAA